MTVTPTSTVSNDALRPVGDDVGRDRLGGRLVERWPAAWPFFGIGSLSIIAGGFVAAVTRPTGFDLGSWLAAFLVLVGGVAQLVLGLGQAWMAAEHPRPSVVAAEILLWNIGMALTVVGSLTSIPVVTTIGAPLVIAALVLFLLGVRNAIGGVRWPLLLYRSVTVIVLVSTPIGVVLAWR